MHITKNSQVVYRVTSGFVTLEWLGTVIAVRKNRAYVLFDGGGHWIDFDLLSPVQAS